MVSEDSAVVNIMTLSSMVVKTNMIVSQSLKIGYSLCGTNTKKSYKLPSVLVEEEMVHY